MIVLLENRHCHGLDGIEVVLEAIVVIQMPITTQQTIATVTANDKASDEAKVPPRHSAAKRIKPWKISVATVKQNDPGPCLRHDQEDVLKAVLLLPVVIRAMQPQEVDSPLRRASNVGTRTILPMLLVI